MRPYQIAGLLLVTSALACVIGVNVGENRALRRLQASGPHPGIGSDADCCAPLPVATDEPTTRPYIPSGSGLPCLIQFGSDECEACRKMDQVLDELAPRLEGKVEVVRIDSDVHPAEATTWRLRLIPTQVFLDPDGEEVHRHEGYLAPDEVLARLKTAGAKL